MDNNEVISPDEEFRRLYRLDAPRHRKYFTDKPYVDLFGGTVIGAHVATFFERMITGVTSNKYFIIDPMTYMFARDRENMMRIKIMEDGTTKKLFKKSFEGLAKMYGDTLQNIVLQEKRELSPMDFITRGNWNEHFVNEFLKGVLDFQKKFVTSSEEVIPLDVLELMDEKERSTLSKEKKIYALVPPYFYAANVDDEWYKISLRLAELSLSLEEEYKLAPVLCISKNLILSDDTIKKITKDYSEKNFERIIIWVSDFNEFRESVDCFRGIIKLVSSLKENGVKPYSAYGGFFFALLYQFGLEGFSQGICYAERKDVDKPPSLGAPRPRYYIPILHRKVTVENARTYFGVHPDELCNCIVCQALKENLTKAGLNIKEQPADFIDEFFRLLTDEYRTHHFLISRKEELGLVRRKKDISSTIEWLRAEISQSENVDMPSFKGFENTHLKRWLRALSSL